MLPSLPWSQFKIRFRFRFRFRLRFRIPAFPYAPFQMTNDFPFEIFTVKNSCFTSIHNYGSVILWNLDFGSFCEWRYKFARSWSICVILSYHCIIVPHLNDKWFFYHKLYHPKLLWLIHIAQWYSEILILVHFASDGTSLPDLEACVILSDHRIILFHI